MTDTITVNRAGVVAEDGKRRAQPLDRNRLRRNDYGFTFGGPVWIPKLYDGKNRIFFFFNFEQFRQNNVTGSGIATVSTLAYRNGDFSTALCNSYTGGTVKRRRHLRALCRHHLQVSFVRPSPTT